MTLGGARQPCSFSAGQTVQVLPTDVPLDTAQGHQLDMLTMASSTTQHIL